MDFDKIITGIRKALYGREVREYIASAIEWVKSTITDALEKMKELLKQAEAARDAAKGSADKSAASATDSANSAAASKRSAGASAVSANASANSADESAGYASASANSANESAGHASDSAASAAASEVSAKNSANAAMKALQEAADSGAFKGDKGDTGPAIWYHHPGLRYHPCYQQLDIHDRFRCKKRRVDVPIQRSREWLYRCLGAECDDQARKCFCGNIGRVWQHVPKWRRIYSLLFKSSTLKRN